MKQIMETIIVVTLEAFIKLFGFEIPEKLETPAGQPVKVCDAVLYQQAVKQGLAPDPLNVKDVWVVAGTKNLLCCKRIASQLQKEGFGRIYPLETTLKFKEGKAKEEAETKAKAEAKAKAEGEKQAKVEKAFWKNLLPVLEGDFSGKKVFSQAKFASLTLEALFASDITGSIKPAPEKFVKGWTDRFQSYIGLVNNSVEKYQLRPMDIQSEVSEIHKQQGDLAPRCNLSVLRIQPNDERHQWYYIVVPRSAAREIKERVIDAKVGFVFVSPLHVLYAEAKVQVSLAETRDLVQKFDFGAILDAPTTGFSVPKKESKGKKRRQNQAEALAGYDPNAL